MKTRFSDFWLKSSSGPILPLWAHCAFLLSPSFASFLLQSIKFSALLHLSWNIDGRFSSKYPNSQFKIFCSSLPLKTDFLALHQINKCAMTLRFHATTDLLDWTYRVVSGKCHVNSGEHLKFSKYLNYVLKIFVHTEWYYEWCHVNSGKHLKFST